MIEHTELIRKLPFELVEGRSPNFADDVFMIRDKNKKTVLIMSMGLDKQDLAEYIVKACNEHEQFKQETEAQESDIIELKDINEQLKQDRAELLALLIETTAWASGYGEFQILWEKNRKAIIKMDGELK